MFSVSYLCVVATGLLCNSMHLVVSFLYFCMLVNIYANRKKSMTSNECCASSLLLDQLGGLGAYSPRKL